jgi:murein DD-endopeptidase MepM/ murein hydrolase activator NlpD
VQATPVALPQSPAATNSAVAAAVAVTATAAPAPVAWTTFTVRPGDTLEKLFAKAGIDKAECGRVMALGAPVKTLRLLHPGEQIRLRGKAGQALAELCYAPDALHTLDVVDGSDGLEAHLTTLKPTLSRTVVSDEINETLGRALQRAGLDKATAAEFIGIFHWRVDFRREIRRGTRFTVVYDKRRVGDKQLSPGPIVAAKLVLHDQTLQAFRFAGADGEAGYYDAHGRSMHPTLLRTPVHYTRISSPFSLHRFDPVVHVWRPHYGVDLAAPSGTPVEAAGDGRIVFIGRDGGYGNLIKIDNFGPYTTRYAHLRRFARGLHAGSHVHQGQIIGYVGETGEATGPHLHFEIRVNGRPHNPLTVRLPAGEPLSHRERRHFEASIQPLVAMLDNAGQGQPQLARNENRRFTVASRQ